MPALENPESIALGPQAVMAQPTAPKALGIPLVQRARRAVAWNTAFLVLRDLVQFGVMLVLVRILPPVAYGKFGLTSTIIGFISICSSGSFLSYTLQLRGDRDIDYQAQFTAAGVLQVGLFVVANLVAVVLRNTSTYGEVSVFVHVLSVTFLLEWPTEFRRKILERQLDWKRLRILHGIGIILNGVIAVVMGELGAGVYALLLPGMAVTLPFVVDLFWIQRWRPSFVFDWRGYRATLGFGLNRVGSAALIRGRALAESSFITATAGLTALAFFGRAIGLAQLLCQRVAAQLLYALYPALTRLQPRTAPFQKAAKLVLQAVASVIVPAATLFCIVATPLVLAVYGGKWLPVIPLLPFALVGVTLGSLQYVAYQLLLAQMRHGLCLVVDAALNILVVGLLVFVLPHGLRHYLFGLAALYACFFMGTLTLLVRDAGITVTGVIDALLPGCSGTVLAALVATALYRWMHSQGPILACGLTIAAFGVVYLATLRLLFRRQLLEFISHLPPWPALRGLLMLRTSLPTQTRI